MVCECKACGHTWVERVKNPVACPRCKSTTWKYGPKYRRTGGRKNVGSTTS